MGKKLYKNDSESGGIGFVYRREGFVQVANYVIDLWLPLISAKGLAVYALYCRLAREKFVKAIPQHAIAKSLRMGKTTLQSVNDMLEDCGFIEVRKPEGYEVSMHWTTTIEVLDPPKTISKEIIEKYQHPTGYSVLCRWLVDDAKNEECDNIVSPMTQIGHPIDDPNRSSDVLNRSSKNEDLNVEDLEIENLEKECAKENQKALAQAFLSEWEDRKASKNIEDKFRLAKEYQKKAGLEDEPLDWVVAHARVLLVDENEVAAAKEKRQAVVDGIELDRERYIKNMRSWIYPPYIDLAIAFFNATGIRAVGDSERKAWVKSFDRMYKKRIKPRDIMMGVKRMREISMFPKSPFSVEHFANSARENREMYEIHVANR